MGKEADKKSQWPMARHGDLFGGKLCSGFVWGLELSQIQFNHLPFSGFALEEKGKSSLQCISEMNKQISGKAGVSRLAEDPCNLLLSLDEVQVLSSGSSKYRDFIRYLPLHISKYILSMLGSWGDFSETSHLGPALGGFWVHLLSFSPRNAG